jgi:DNA-binding protein HU-beta
VGAMNKAELVEAVAGVLELSGARAQAVVAAVLEGIRDGLKKDGTVSLVNFGTFEVRRRKPRAGRNPRTGESIAIKASTSVGFRAGRALKDAV